MMYIIILSKRGAILLKNLFPIFLFHSIRNIFLNFRLTTTVSKNQKRTLALSYVRHLDIIKFALIVMFLLYFVFVI